MTLLHSLCKINRLNLLGSKGVLLFTGYRQEQQQQQLPGFKQRPHFFVCLVEENALKTNPSVGFCKS